jgi:glycine/D-amino acid oxidase-like deaminating enzyme
MVAGRMGSAIVVGAGVFGSSIADRLAGDGWSVTLVDQFEPGDRRASSGGESRLLRYSHGEAEWYARSAWRARKLWRELDPALLVETGVAWLARRDDGWEAASERVLHALGIPVERLDPIEATRLFPSFTGDGLAFVLLEPAAGVLRARAATRALATRAVERGARLVRARARPDGERVALDDGRRLEADEIVWASGAWLASLFPGLVDLRATRQDVLLFRAPDADWGTPPVPAWVDYEGAFYGVGDLDGDGVKVASDTEGPEIDPDADSRPASADSEDRAREYMASRFPALADAPLARTTTCRYELTADTHFILAHHPEHERVWIAGGGSGHGFKHGPALAEHVAALLRGETQAEPRFALGPRLPGGKLHTTGELSRPRASPPSPRARP